MRNLLILILLTLTTQTFANVYLNTAKVELKPNSFSKYIQAVDQADVLRQTKLEQGNLQYELYRTGKNEVLFSEVWRNKEDLDKHLGEAHMQAFFAKVGFNPALYHIKSKTISGRDVTVFILKEKNSNSLIWKLILMGQKAQQINTKYY